MARSAPFSSCRWSAWRWSRGTASVAVWSWRAGCDLILASESSTFGQPEIKLGCYPPLAAALYPHLVGTGNTVELLLGGSTISARRAQSIGFVTHCVEDRPPRGSAQRADRILDGSQPRGQPDCPSGHPSRAAPGFRPGARGEREVLPRRATRNRRHERRYQRFS